MADPQQATPDTSQSKDERDAPTNDTKRPSEQQKSEAMRKADVSDGESP